MTNSRVPPNRMIFQRGYFTRAPKGLQPSGLPYVLNIGCAEDPCRFGDEAMHFDMDDWSKRHRYFTQGDAEDLSAFPDRSFHTVIMGDVLEHIVHPEAALVEACRVCASTLVLTVFEEWRVGGPGLHIENAQRVGDAGAREQGYADGEDWQIKRHPDRVGVPNLDHPHLFHIWTFTDEDIERFSSLICHSGFRSVEFSKAPEGFANGKQWMNWLMVFERIPDPPKPAKPTKPLKEKS